MTTVILLKYDNASLKDDTMIHDAASSLRQETMLDYKTSSFPTSEQLD